MRTIKVEINGVNTADLPVLSAKEQGEMIIKIKEGHTELKQEFVNANLRLVLSLVKKFNHRCDNVDDIFQVGVVGLIKAIDNFDITQNVQFSTYAVPMIIGEIKRYLRDSSSMRISRSIRDLSYKLSKEKEEYISKNNSEPTIEYLAKAVGANEEDVILALDSTVQPMSLYDAVYNDGGDVIYVLDQLKNEKNEVENLTDTLSVLQALEKLSEKERNIIKRRFFDNKTQVELAEEIGVSQAQISRIEKVALERMKRRMLKEWDYFHSFNIYISRWLFMYKVYLSPSTQSTSFGAQDFGTEEYRMNQIADSVEKRLLETGEFIVFRNKTNMTKKEIIEQSNNLKTDMHIAIHSNYGGAQGPECFVKVGDERSNGIAKEIYKSLMRIYYDRSIDNGLSYNNEIVEIMSVETSSVLVEVGYHDNIKDAKWIVENIEKIGIAIADGIIASLKLKVC